MGNFRLAAILKKWKSLEIVQFGKAAGLERFMGLTLFFYGHFRPNRKSKNKMTDAKWLPHRWAIRICNKKKWAEPNKKCLREGKWELRGKESLYEQLTERIFQIGEGVLEISKCHEKGVSLYGRYSKSLTYKTQIFISFRNWLTMTNGKRIFQIEETVFEISLNMGSVCMVGTRNPWRTDPKF